MLTTCSLHELFGLHCVMEKSHLKKLMLWPPADVKVCNVALTMKYSISVALSLKRLDTPALNNLKL